MCNTPDPVENFNESYNSEKEELKELLDLIKRERVKLADERAQNNALIRRMTREDTIKEIAKEAVEGISNKIQLPKVSSYNNPNMDLEGILLLSDWHYGVDVENYFNTYNPEICKDRVAQLRDKVIRLIKEKNISFVTVLNLGDMISGRIHNTIRINNRIDVITQVIEVSEILAEFLNSISDYCCISYLDTLDNHSRVEPNLKDSLDLESLTRVINEFLKLRLKDNKNIIFLDNVISDDIICCSVFNHNICAVHGDKDKINKVIDNLTGFVGEHFDLICTAHLHHFNADEKNFTRRIGNGSLMGTDDFAHNLRLSSTPSQTFIVADKDNVTKEIHIIDLE